MLLKLRPVLSFSTRCVLFALVVFLLRHVAPAQAPANLGPAESKRPKKEEYVLRTYEVGDLVLSVPDYPYSAPRDPMTSRFAAVPGGGMGMGGMGGVGMPGMAARAADTPMTTSNVTAITVQDLCRVLVTLVAPQSWAQDQGNMGTMGMGPAGYGRVGMDPLMGPGPGGAMQPAGAAVAPETPPRPQGEIQPLGYTLIVRQTPAVHRQIQDLLTQLRQRSGRRRTVAVDARWLVLDSDDLDRLTSPDKQGRLQVDRRVLDEFTRRPTSIRGLTNCFSGQLVYLVGGTRRNVVSGYIPVVGSLDLPRQPDVRLASLHGAARVTYVQDAMNPLAPSRQSSVGYQPVIEKPNFGTLLEIRPTVLPPDDDSAIVDLRSTITVPSGPITAPNPDHEGPLVPAIDRLAIETQELATTLIVPFGRPVLVGGLTYVGPLASPATQSDPNPSPARPGHGRAQPRQRQQENPETPQLYLVLELR